MIEYFHTLGSLDVVVQGFDKGSLGMILLMFFQGLSMKGCLTINLKEEMVVNPYCLLVLGVEKT